MEFVSAEYIENPDSSKSGFKICYSGESGVFEVGLLGENLELFRNEIIVRELRSSDEEFNNMEHHTFDLNGVKLILSGTVVKQIKSFLNA